MVKIKTAQKRFWNKKKVFLTGHTSFKGSWLKLWLEFLGAKVTGYSLNYPSQPECLYKTLYKEKILKQSVLNNKNLEKQLLNSKADIVFHMAAQSILSDASEDPIKNYLTNIIGTASILEACTKVKTVKTLIVVTTDKCYKENDKIKFYTERSSLGGSEPYSASKACAEIISNSYLLKFKKLKKKIVTVRAGNVVGGGDWKKNRIVPDIIRSILEKKKLKIRNPKYTRPWLNVLDCLNGYLIAAEYSFSKKNTFNTWNFAPPLKNQIKVIDLANLIFLKFRKKNNIKIIKNNHFYESKRLNLNPYKAKNELGWKVILNKKKSVEYIYNWYFGYMKKKNMKKLSLEQIKNFYKVANKIKVKK